PTASDKPASPTEKSPSSTVTMTTEPTNDLIEESTKLAHDGKFADALHKLAGAPQTEMCHYLKGLCYTRLSKFDEAIKEFSWLYYYGKNPTLHRTVMTNLEELERVKHSDGVSVQDSMMKGMNALKEQSKTGDLKGAEAGSPQEFFAVVRIYFGKWDGNRDGVLTGDEIAKAIQNPGIHGEEAVALAALKTQERDDFRDQGQFSRFTPADIASLQAGFAAGNSEAKDLVNFYRQGIIKVKQQSMQLFADGFPHINGIRQGHTSDCYFLSVVGALVCRDPEAVRRMIQPNGDGTFTVSFCQGSPIRVNAPTLAEIATYADSGGDGYWLTVLEKAYGELKESSGDGGSMLEPLDAVTIHGGKLSPVMVALTGRVGKWYSFKSQGTRQNIRTLLSDAAARGVLVCTTVPGHCLAMMSYKPGYDQVQIWNPWGSTKYYSAVGVTMDNGFFVIPISQFLEKFEGVSIQQ
ncbi:MAG: hypothetical protein K2Z81_15670, partial [Cyanobacteria bacterium]|nr:hypothetical protein [Cyanobacteriota bacterium]